MALQAHGDRKYHTSERLGDLAEWASLRIERRRLEAGLQSDLTLECNEIVMTLGGRSVVRRTGDGDTQKTFAQAGTTWLCPTGVFERNIELSAPLETLHIYLPSTLIEQGALVDYEIDASKCELAYAGGFTDPMLQQICVAFDDLMGRPIQPTDRLFVDGMRTALAAHLLGRYSADQWLAPTKTPSLDAKRLKRVIDYIETHLADDISLDALAGEAHLSPYHFSRLFNEATGSPPHRYVTDRRVQVAQEKLARGGASMVEIALDTGFGSQANFIRVFRKATGLTPGQYRELCRR